MKGEEGRYSILKAYLGVSHTQLHKHFILKHETYYEMDESTGHFKSNQ